MRLIDADALAKKHRSICSYNMKHNLDLAPTIDAVPVVRCKDCNSIRTVSKSGRKMPQGVGWCDLWDGTCLLDAFCSYGERKDGDS